MDFQKMNAFTQSQSLFNCLKYIHIYFGYSRNPLSRRYRNNNFFKIFWKEGQGDIARKENTHSIYIYINSLVPKNPRFQSQSPQRKKNYIDESWESYLAWAMNPRNQIYLDFDIFENKVKVNCKIIFFLKTLIYWILNQTAYSMAPLQLL